MADPYLIREAREKDLPEIMELFTSTVLQVNCRDYSPEQVAVWSKGGTRNDAWQEAIVQQYFLVATFHETITGFGSLTREGYLHFLYIDYRFQRKGIARSLYHLLEEKAREYKLASIRTDASITALPFFLKSGFVVLSEQTVNLDGISLTNYQMKKDMQPSG